MKAWEVFSDGGIDALVPNERVNPEVSPGQVLVQVGASSINYRDLVTIEDPIQRNIKFPMIPNFDCAGEVLARPGGPKCIIWQKSHRIFFQGWVEGPISHLQLAEHWKVSLLSRLLPMQQSLSNANLKQSYH